MGVPAPQPLRIGTRQELDTANPESDRPPGTLVTAQDLHHKWIGPRKGRYRIASAWRCGSTPAAVDAQYVTNVMNIYATYNGSSDTAYGYLNNDKFRDLGTTWTVDVFLSLADAAYTTDPIHVMSWFTGSVEAIRITISPSTLRPTATVKVTDSRSNVNATTSFTASAGYTVQTGAESSQNARTHLRLVRDGGSLYWFVNGLAAGTVALSDVYPTEGAIGSAGIVRISYGAIAASHAYFKGRIWGVIVRETAHRDLPIEAVFPSCPQASNVKLFYTADSATKHATASSPGAAVFGLYDAGPYHVQAKGPAFNTRVNTDRFTESPPMPAPIQGMATVVTRDGNVMSAVMCGGVLNLRYVT